MTILKDVPLYAHEPLQHAQIFAAVAVIGFIFTVVYLLRSKGEPRQKTISQVLLALWVLGPPLWFFYEHFYYFPTFGNMADGAGFEKLKAAQDVTSKVWAAFAVVLGAIYNKKYPG
ncbi:MAG: hypothetical protein EOO15_03885 [Chitinophagaceae bacterium]|nr:MAG: hypothetical protein EOO15_03885 [Chitinophagaceae bacterium]